MNRSLLSMINAASSLIDANCHTPQEHLTIVGGWLDELRATLTAAPAESGPTTPTTTKELQ